MSCVSNNNLVYKSSGFELWKKERIHVLSLFKLFANDIFLNIYHLSNICSHKNKFQLQHVSLYILKCNLMQKTIDSNCNI